MKSSLKKRVGSINVGENKVNTTQDISSDHFHSSDLLDITKNLFLSTPHTPTYGQEAKKTRPPTIPGYRLTPGMVRASSPHSKAKRQLYSTFQQSLYKDPSSRTCDDISILIHFCHTLEAFKELDSPTKCKEICEVMTHLKIPYDHTLFVQGDDATNMYIILRGTVAVMVKAGGNTVPTQEEQQVVTLGAGEKVGHLALVKDVPRSATIVALEETEFLVISKQSYQKILKFTHKSEIEMNSSFLKKFPLFQAMPPLSMGRLAEIAIHRSFSSQDVVFDIGDETDGLYLIKAGSVDLWKEVSFTVNIDKSEENSPTKKIHKVLKIGSLEGNEFFGEMSIYYKTHRMSRAIATSDLKCLFINKYDFEARTSLQTLQSLCENVKSKYPTNKMLRDSYYDLQENKKWENYKSGLLKDIMKDREHKKILSQGCNLRYSPSPKGKNQWIP